MKYTNNVEAFFHYLATLQNLGRKIINSGHKPDSVEWSELREEMDKLYKLGFQQGLSIKEITMMLLRKIFLAQTV